MSECTLGEQVACLQDLRRLVDLVDAMVDGALMHYNAKQMVCDLLRPGGLSERGRECPHVPFPVFGPTYALSGIASKPLQGVARRDMRLAVVYVWFMLLVLFSIPLG